MAAVCRTVLLHSRRRRGLGAGTSQTTGNQATDLTGIRSSAFMLMYGVVWVSLIWMYWTEVRRSELMGRNAREFALNG